MMSVQSVGCCVTSNADGASGQTGVWSMKGASGQAGARQVGLLGLICALLALAWCLAMGSVAWAADDDLVENSWRYSNGQRIELEDQGITLFAEDDEAVSLLAGSIVAKGIDVSEHQSTIDWQAVKNSGKVDFVIIRCGFFKDNGLGRADYQWERNVSECERLGIPYGVYVYTYSTSATRTKEIANEVIGLLKGHSPAYPVYLDLEDDVIVNAFGSDTSKYARIAKAFCETVQAAGYTPGVYANLNWFNNYLTDSCFDHWERWVAQWASSCTYKKSYHLWQNSDSGSVSGISGSVDTNYELDYVMGKATVANKYQAPNGAYSRTVEDGTYMICSKVDTGFVLDVSSASKSAGANVQLWSSNGTNAQRFELKRDAATGYYYIKNVNSGMYLGLNARDGGYDANVVQKKFSASDPSQKWRVLTKSNGYYEIVSALNTDYSLDVSGGSASAGANVQIYASNGTNAQRFFLQNVNVSGSTATLEAGFYTITPAGHSDYALDVSGASLSGGANVQLYRSNRTFAQVFYVEPTGDGFYTITCVQSGLSLGVANGEASGASVVQRGKALKWSLKEQGSGYALTSQDSGLCLDISGGSFSNYSNVQLWFGNGTAAQAFSFQPYTFDKTVAAGTYTLRQAGAPALVAGASGNASGKNVSLTTCTDVAGQSITLTRDAVGLYTVTMPGGCVLDIENGDCNNGSNVQQYSSNGSFAQKWIITKNSDGSFTLRNALKAGYVLDVKNGSLSSGSNLQMWSSNGTNAQKFVLVDDGSSRVEGSAVVASALKSDGSKALDVSGASTNAGANVQLYDTNGTEAQKFIFSYDSKTGFYTLINAKSGMALDVSGASTADGANVQQYTTNGTAAQKWLLLSNGDGTVTIVSALDATKCLDISGASTSNYTNVQLYSANGTKAQRFMLKK